MPVLDQSALDVLFHEAHTAYAFDATPVSDEKLEQAVEMMRLAPTALNAGPLRIVFVRSAEAKAKLIPLLSEGNRAKSESAPVVAILAADLDFHEHLPTLQPRMPDAKERFADPARREPMAMNNAWLQAGYFILAVRALGLDAGPMAGFDRPGVDTTFFQGTAQRSFLVVNIGHVAEGGVTPRNPRLSFNEIATAI